MVSRRQKEDMAGNGDIDKRVNGQKGE